MGLSIQVCQIIKLTLSILPFRQHFWSFRPLSWLGLGLGLEVTHSGLSIREHEGWVPATHSVQGRQTQGSAFPIPEALECVNTATAGRTVEIHLSPLSFMVRPQATLYSFLGLSLTNL